jgi:hypothetical protein
MSKPKKTIANTQTSETKPETKFGVTVGEKYYFFDGFSKTSLGYEIENDLVDLGTLEVVGFSGKKIDVKFKSKLTNGLYQINHDEFDGNYYFTWDESITPGGKLFQSVIKNKSTIIYESKRAIRQLEADIRHYQKGIEKQDKDLETIVKVDRVNFV